ncbi:MAG: hypothetical protein ACM3L6_06290 [Deltaproteobacteria bacterium]
MALKALSLISGGLDSTLATKVVMEQGVEVTAVNFVSPFCRCDHGARGKNGGCRHEAKFVSEELGIPLKIVNVTQDFLDVIRSPKHGYGSNMNPCIDCRILMLKKAKELMREMGASFLITGEVLGQRPMSQHGNAMRTIEREAGVEGILLRPLSAKLLEPTVPEQNGWVDREKLLAISGRSRKPQMELAENYNVKDYPCPAGGCLLTDPHFSRRIRDLIDHDLLTLEDALLLNHGRHFRLSAGAKLVVGRDEHDNQRIEGCRKDGDVLFQPAPEATGPSALGRGPDYAREDIRLLAARLTARYFDQKEGSVTVLVTQGAQTRPFSVVPLTPEETKAYLL